MRASEFAVLFGTSQADRVARAEQFVRAARVLCAGALTACDLGLSGEYSLLAVVLRLDRDAAGPGLRDRLEFWASRCGGTTAWDSACARAGRSLLALCEHRRDAVAPAGATAALAELLELAGVQGGADAGLWFDLDLATPQADGVRWDDRAATLFVPSLRAPPAGDAIAVRLSRGGGAPWVLVGAVTASCRAGHHGPGTPAGFLVRATRLPAEARQALVAHSEGERPRRRAPRFAVRLAARLAGAPGSAVEDPGAVVENLSQGGAYVRTAARPPLGEPVRLAMQLPWGATFFAPAVVAFSGSRGVGVRFQLDAEAEQALSEAIGRLTCRARTAIVVDDDALARRMLGDALSERGFGVRAAQEGHAGMHLLLEGLLETDLLVTDLRMPTMDGETFVRTIRGAGGERDVRIVVATGAWAPEIDARLRAVGADAVLDKALGAAVVARVAEAIVDRQHRDAGVAPAAAPAAEPALAAAC